jgi:hypothetical protein
MVKSSRKADPKKKPAPPKPAAKAPVPAPPKAPPAEPVAAPKATDRVEAKVDVPAPTPRVARRLYSPADEPLPFTYRARPFTLAPNVEQSIVSPWGEVTPDTILDYVLEFFKNVGVREVFGDDRDAAIKIEAESVHADWLREVAGIAKPKADARVDFARAALKKRGLLPTGDKE